MAGHKRETEVKRKEPRASAMADSNAIQQNSRWRNWAKKTLAMAEEAETPLGKRSV